MNPTRRGHPRLAFLTKRSFSLHGAGRVRCVSPVPQPFESVALPGATGEVHRGGLRQFALLGPGEARPRGQVVAAASNPSSSVNDAADAEAIAEAASRPTFVAVKTEEQQGWQARSLFVRQRTQTALRGHLAEFGIVAPQGATNVRKLALLASPELPGASRADLLQQGFEREDRRATGRSRRKTRTRG